MQLNLNWPDGMPHQAASSIGLQFHQGMLDRMSMSYFKYGGLDDESMAKTDLITSAQDRVIKYLETGNTEWLMDAANYIMMEFMYPKIEGSHFRVTEGDESPGYRTVDGEQTDVHKRDL